MQPTSRMPLRRAASFTFRTTLTLALLWGAQGSADSLAPQPPRGKGEQCVEPTEVMRREHMTFLVHKRDDTVHRGIRTTQHSLTECLSCHTRQDAQGNYIAVNAQGEFCQICHAFVGVSMDCFGCHASKPSPKGNQATRR